MGWVWRIGREIGRGEGRLLGILCGCTYTWTYIQTQMHARELANQCFIEKKILKLRVVL